MYLKSFRVLALLVFIQQTGYADIIGKTLVPARISNEFSITVRMHHPINPPLEVYLKSTAELSKYFYFDQTYNAAKVSPEFEQMINKKSGENDGQWLFNSSYGDKLCFNIASHTKNISNFQIEVNEIPDTDSDGTWIEATISGNLLYSAEKTRDVANLIVSMASSVVPSAKNEYECTILFEENVESIFGDELDQPDVGGGGGALDVGCCLPCTDNDELMWIFRIDPWLNASGSIYFCIDPDSLFGRNLRIVALFDLPCGNWGFFNQISLYDLADLYPYRNMGFITKPHTVHGPGEWQYERDVYCTFFWEEDGSINKIHIRIHGLSGWDVTLYCYASDCGPVEGGGGELNENEIVGDIFHNKLPALFTGMEDESCLEYGNYPGMQIRQLTFDKDYTTDLFPKMLSSDNLAPKEVEITCTTNEEWIDSLAYATFLISPLLADAGEDDKVILNIACDEADSSGTYQVEIDPEKPWIPKFVYFGKITPLNDAYTVSMEIVEGDYVVFDQVKIVSDSIHLPVKINIAPRSLKLSTPRTVGMPIDLLISAGFLSSNDKNDVGFKVWFENINDESITDTINITQNNELPTLLGNEAHHLIYADQKWIPENPGKYRGYVLLTPESNYYRHDDSLATFIFDVDPSGILAYGSPNIDQSTIWYNESDSSLTSAVHFQAQDTIGITLLEVLSCWLKDGPATLKIQSNDNNQPDTNIVNPIQIAVTNDDLFPKKLSTSIQFDSVLVGLTDFWVIVESPMFGASLCQHKLGSLDRNHFRIENDTLREEFGDWLIEARGIQGGTVVFGDIHGSWTAENNPYVLTDDVEIPIDSTLNINPGVTVLSLGDFQFQVEGTLIAEGTVDSQIFFGTVPGAGAWEGLLFSEVSENNSLINLTIDGGDYGIYAFKSEFDSLNYLTIQNCGVGFSSENVDYDLYNSMIEYCNEGVYAYLGKPELFNVELTRNYGHGAYLDNIYVGGLYECHIHDNGQSGMAPGLVLFRSSPDIEACIIEDNPDNGILIIEYSDPIMNTYPSGYGQTNVIRNNGPRTEGGDPLQHAEIQIIGGSLPLIYDGHNDIYDDDAGLLMHRVTQQGDPMLYVDDNYYDSPLENGPGTWFQQIADFQFSPIDSSRNNPEVMTENQADLAFESALELEKDGDFEEAFEAYLEIIETYSDSAAAFRSLRRIVGIGLQWEDGLSEIRSELLDLDEDDFSDLMLFDAANLAVRCLAYMGNYVVPLSEYAENIENPVSELDSVFAVIDSHRVALDAELEMFKIARGSMGESLDRLALAQRHQSQYIDRSLALINSLATYDNQRQYPERIEIPDNFELGSAYPNPFNPTISINFGLPEKANVKLSIYNILGQRVIQLLDGPMQAGYHVARWDGSSDSGLEVSSGMYFVSMEAKSYKKVKKIVLLK